MWLELSLKADYYKTCYERGDIKLYIRCAEWLELQLSGCTVYYGTDCSPDAVRFDSQLRAKYMRYYEKVGACYRLGRTEQEQVDLEKIWERC